MIGCAHGSSAVPGLTLFVGGMRTATASSCSCFSVKRWDTAASCLLLMVHSPLTSDTISRAGGSSSKAVDQHMDRWRQLCVCGHVYEC